MSVLVPYRVRASSGFVACLLGRVLRPRLWKILWPRLWKILAANLAFSLEVPAHRGAFGRGHEPTKNDPATEDLDPNRESVKPDSRLGIVFLPCLWIGKVA